MKIYIGADHRGYKLKEKIKNWLLEWSYKYEDLGAYKLNSQDDYPDFARKVAKTVERIPKSLGIVICGTGLGSCIAANKVKGVRATSAFNVKMAIQAKEHLNANILCLGAKIQRIEDVKKIIKIWLETKFTGEKRHLRRIKKING